MFTPKLAFTRTVAAAALLTVGFLAGRLDRTGTTRLRANFPARKPPTEVRAFARVESSLPRSGSSLGNWNDRWAAMQSRPPSPERDATAADLLAQLAAKDPQRAVALALNERNELRRAQWIHAVLRGWSSADTAPAMAWVLSHPEVEREGAEAALFAGAEQTSSGCVSLCEALLQQDPSNARSHVGQLLRALNDQGQYEDAVAFAQRLPGGLRSEMLGTAYQYWAVSDPARALDAALRPAPDEDGRSIAIEAVICGWAQVDASGLAERATHVESPVDRTKILEVALREWVRKDVPAASRWLNALDPAPELDAGAAAVALEPAVGTVRPDVAVGWAESITNPTLRSSTVAEVVRAWASHDLAAAWNYAESSSSLIVADRAALLQELQATSPH